MHFTLNPAGVDQFVKSARVKRFVSDVAEKVGHEAEQQAARFANTGTYEDSIVVLPPEPTPDGVKVTVTSSDPDAHLIEWGSVNNPPYAPLRKAVMALGLRLRVTKR